jgi:outer membrane protein assembly factor BamB
MNTPLFLLFSLLALAARASDWPQFRGPGGTGLSPDAQIPAPLRIDWSVPLPGRGLASPIVVGDKLFVTASSGPEQRELHLFCFAASDGHQLWERRLRATGRTMSHPKASVASSTPCSDGSHVFALWSSNDLAAFDLAGNLLWLRGLTVDYPNASSSIGMASSPMVIGETLVVVIENGGESYSLGLDTKNGKNLWKIERTKADNWTSPVSWSPRPAASPAVLLQNSKGLLAVDPVSGSRLWEYSDATSTMSSSVVAEGIVYTPSNGITALRPQESGAEPEQLWRAKAINPSTISPVVLDGHLFSINGAGVLAAADPKAGTPQWKLRLSGPFSGSPVGAGRRLLAVSEKGLVQVVDISAPAGALLGQLQLPLDPDTKELVLCTPALSGSHVYVRADSKLWCLGE